MPNLKISQLTGGGAAQAGDEYVVARSGGNNKITGANVAAAATSVGTLTSLAISGNAVLQTINGSASALTEYRIGGVAQARVGTQNFATGDLSLVTLTSAPVVLGTNNAERMRLDSSGNLGIGTASPSFRLTASYTAPATFTNAASDFLQMWQASGTNAIGLALNTTGTVARFVTNNSYVFAWNNASSELMRLDASGNLGLGVTPSAWAIGKVLQIASAGGAFVYGASGQTILGTNAFFDTSWKYGITGEASNYEQALGVHKWFTAPSGTAGNAISFTQAMTLDASGNLGVGETSPAARVHIKGAGEMQRFAGNATGAELFQTWYNSANTRRGYFGYTSNNDSRILLYNEEAGPIFIGTNNSQRVSIPAAGGFVVGTAALATSAVDGFLYVPTCAGTPTGTPTTQTGTAPIVVDTTNHKLYFFSGGTWRDAGP